MIARAELIDRENLPREDHFVHLHGVSWADYERILEIRGDKSAPRISYLEGTLEIMSPSLPHDSIKSTIGRLVEVWCLEHDIEFLTAGSWTVKNKRKKRGVEPDECYVFSAFAAPKRPDLAIEVVWTSGGIDKLDVYRKLGVPEVWWWEAGAIQVHRLRGERYSAVRASVALRGIDLVELARFLDQPTTSQAIRAYRAALKRRSAR
jgi:Uma2 family endonuclease